MAKRKFGDRRDAALMRNVDSMHFIMPHIFPNRCDNEAFISERIELTKLEEYLQKKNADDPAYKYNMFQVIVTAVLKACTLRPKMNIFVKNKRYFMRNELTAAFTVKKVFSDEGGESLAFIHAKEDDNIDTIHEKLYKKIFRCKTEGANESTEDAMDIFNKMPFFLSRFIINIVRFLDNHGWIPKSLINNDPYHASVLLTNLGSIKLHAGYHHLSNWGTTSVFVIVGERKKRPFYNEDGTFEMKDSIDLGLTVDERIADGYYFSKTVRLLKKLLENPELLDKPMKEEVEY